jgi:hypothetical protein
VLKNPVRIPILVSALANKKKMPAKKNKKREFKLSSPIKVNYSVSMDKGPVAALAERGFGRGIIRQN